MDKKAIEEMGMEIECNNQVLSHEKRNEMIEDYIENSMPVEYKQESFRLLAELRDTINKANEISESLLELREKADNSFEKYLETQCDDQHKYEVTNYSGSEKMYMTEVTAKIEQEAYAAFFQLQEKANYY